MSANIELQEADGSSFRGIVRLTEVSAEDGEAAMGQLHGYRVANTGSTTFHEVTIAVDGPGAPHVALAVDADGRPGVWAQPGMSIRLAERVYPGDHALFWARAYFGPEDVEDVLPFDLRLRCRSVGQSPPTVSA